ncbi:MAG: tetratricopeptide repeat protein [Gemmatimonadetes bacterium]|nr:tetratricopeptide repeat protein [Gemmatimonadota bacterium]
MRNLVAGIGIGIALSMSTAGAAIGQRIAPWGAPADCELNTGHYLINSAVLYIRTAAGARFPDTRDRNLRDAIRVLTQALDQGRDNDPAVWFYLGRYYWAERDILGADSAWDKAAAMAPECVAAIETSRRRLWVPILNQGVDALRDDDDEAATLAFEKANVIYQNEPPSFFYLGQIYSTAKQLDSAVYYYDRTIQIANRESNRGNESYQDMGATAAFNVARLYHTDRQYDSAIAWYQRFRQSKPDDAAAITGQASALFSAGYTDVAVVLYDSVLMLAADMPTLDLFTTGVALFRAGQFERAAQAFEAGLERSANYRDALFNLTNTYFRMSDLDSGLADAEREAMEKEYGEKMLPIAQRLVAVDPHSASALRLLAASYQLQSQEDSTLAVLERAQALTFDVTVSVFQAASGGGFEVRGIITNLSDESLTVPAIRFEFVNEAGEVVETAEIPQQTIEPESVAPFQLRPSAEGMAAWRYSSGT